MEKQAKKAPAFDLSKEFGIDPNKEVEGVWEEIGEGAEILVARIGNPAYREAMRKLDPSVRRRIERGTLPEKKARKIMSAIMADTILLGWRGNILLRPGEPLGSYSRQRAEQLLQEIDEFRNFVFEVASDNSRCRLEEVEDQGEGSAPPSAGT